MRYFLFLFMLGFPLFSYGEDSNGDTALATKADEDQTQNDKNNAALLRISQEEAYLKAVQNFVNQGININSQNSNGDTVLIEASKNGYLSVVEFLADAGADMNVQNKYRNTALMWASTHGYLEIVE